jgi:hypothetical protein
MRIGMTNPGGVYSNQHIARADPRGGNLLRLEGRTGFDKANGFQVERVRSDASRALFDPALRIAKRLQREAPLVYASLTKYFLGNCLTSRFSSRRRRVEETVPLGNSDFVAMASIGVSVVSIAS